MYWAYPIQWGYRSKQYGAVALLELNFHWSSYLSTHLTSLSPTHLSISPPLHSSIHPSHIMCQTEATMKRHRSSPQAIHNLVGSLYEDALWVRQMDLTFISVYSQETWEVSHIFWDSPLILTYIKNSEVYSWQLWGIIELTWYPLIIVIIILKWIWRI